MLRQEDIEGIHLRRKFNARLVFQFTPDYTNVMLGDFATHKPPETPNGITVVRR